MKLLLLLGLVTLVGSGSARPSQVPMAAVSTIPQDDIHTLAMDLLERYPLIDTHVDLPQVMRAIGRRPLDEIAKVQKGYAGHVDFPRLKQGGVGGVFWTAWTPCLSEEDTGKDFTRATDTVRDTLESIDLIHEMIGQTEDLELCTTAQQVRDAKAKGKLASLIGMEGSHMLGNSLSVMRMYAQLGVRYLTLTHVCHSSFASSNGGGAGTTGSTLPAAHPGNGLTALGKDLVLELNRLGVMVDLSHVTDNTAKEAIAISRAPVIWSHSGSRTMYNHPRNVPDEILEMIGDGEGKNRGIVLSVAVSIFLSSANATVATVVDHVEHVASKIGKSHVGLASDFDGIDVTAIGLEDASKWPNMVAEFIRRGWTEEEIAGVLGGNLLRVMEEVEEVAVQLKHEKASASIYEARVDLPSLSWAGPNMAYVPEDVKEILRKQPRLRDEL